MTIPRIHVKEVKIPNIYVPDWMNHQPNVDHLVPPVVLNIGNVMNFESDSYEIVAEQITNEISNQFHNHPTNKDALSILKKDLKIEDNEYFSERLKGEPDEVKSILLNQYANSTN